MARRKTEDELDGDACDLLCSLAADRFALALDRMGWMIVRQPVIGRTLVHERADQTLPQLG